MDDITWSAKEVFADLKGDLVQHLDKQDGVLNEIHMQLGGKADKADVIALGAKIEGHGERITSLEEHRAEIESTRKFHNRVWAAVGSIAGVLAILVSALIAAHMH